MEGSEAGIMDGKTQIRWTLGSSHDTRCSRPRRATSGAGAQTGTLCVKPIDATVEILAHASHPRLTETGYVRTAA
jgi:hypothetical protein